MSGLRVDCGLGGLGAAQVRNVDLGPAHQSWTPMKILSDPLGRLECVGADVAE